MALLDPWQTLGLDRSASDDQIKGAYREKAREFHPDRNPSPHAEKHFQEIAEAYRQISSAEARAAWLATNEGAFGQLDQDGSFPPFPGDGDWTTSRAAPAGPLEQSVELDFHQAYTGTQVNVSANIEDVCPLCEGSGAEPGSSPLPCGTCQASGRHPQTRIANGCPDCDGRGYRITRTCPRCGGRGLERRSKSWLLDLPAGVYDGYRIKVESPNPATPVPDLTVTVSVGSSPIFERNLEDPADLLIEVPITYAEAVFGSQVRIPTPERVVELSVPPGTPSGKAFRISGEGMPRMDVPRARGDLYARMVIQVPSKISSKQRKLLDELQSLDPPDLREHLFNPGLR